jgi:hypothetical protein
MGPIFLLAPLDFVIVIFTDVGVGKRKCYQLRKSEHIDPRSGSS